MKLPRPTLKRLLVWFLIGSCLLTIGNDPQRQQQLVGGEVFTALAIVATAATVLQATQSVLSIVYTTWNLVEKATPNSTDEEILQRMKQVSDQIASSEQRILSKTELTVATLMKQMAIESRLEAHLMELTDLMSRISHQERTMRSYLQSSEPVEQLTLEEFARSTVARDPNSAPGLLARIDLLVGGSHDLPFARPGVLEQLAHAFEVQEDKYSVCNLGISRQQVLYHMYNAIVITELKGYAMIQFSWMLLKTYGRGKFTAEAKLMSRSFEDRINRLQRLLQRTMAQVSSEYWRCDPAEPNQHKEGETYLQITRLLQGYIDGSVSVMTCKPACKRIEPCHWIQEIFAVSHICSEIKLCLSRPTECSGKTYDCEHLGTAQILICPASTSRSRRYEFIEYERGKLLGQKKPCSQETTKLENGLAYTCSPHLCLCDEAGPSSDRYINMRQSVSDIGNNKVVTGLRFVKKNRVIYLIVQQGKLLPHGQIDTASLEWVQPEGYSVHSANVRNGRDYHALDYNDRTMDLDDIILQQGYVLTGVGFTLEDGAMKLNARMTEMDFTTGKLVNLPKSVWVKGSVSQRSELKLDQPHIPLLSPSMSVPDSTLGQFIKFRPSDRDSDAAQTTVPFFNAQPVVPGKVVPLGGCGLFHKGQPKFGGYLAPKVFTYNFAPHLVKP